MKKNQLILLDSKAELQTNKNTNEILLKSRSERALNRKNREKKDLIMQKCKLKLKNIIT